MSPNALLARPPPMLPILDIVHRTVVYSLVGLTAYTAFVGFQVHNNTIRAGKGRFVQSALNRMLCVAHGAKGRGGAAKGSS
ncbi:hypothetical protein CPB85DRAFT_484142 [Mucidula mucida]|nr:hypothetical protein CPB85DRAFT_484142 [Mucidula mucida]